jgi:hypothetical protein
MKRWTRAGWALAVAAAHATGCGQENPTPSEPPGGANSAGESTAPANSPDTASGPRPAGRSTRSGQAPRRSDRG